MIKHRVFPASIGLFYQTSDFSGKHRTFLLSIAFFRQASDFFRQTMGAEGQALDFSVEQWSFPSNIGLCRSNNRLFL